MRCKETRYPYLQHQHDSCQVTGLPEILSFTKMFNRLAILVIYSPLIASSSQIDFSPFKPVHVNFQFQRRGTITRFWPRTVSSCTAECHALSSLCGSYSVSKNKTCTLSVLRLNKKVHEPNLVLTVDEGTNIFGKMSGRFCFVNALSHNISVRFGIFYKSESLTFISVCCNYFCLLQYLA